ncbi:LysR family transcriptional regulator [Deefgea piscis]|uniref:LysR family transcriptional regulator n=1 Tax=Deefgea piscis TaxID=2739061 RepID=UPI001C81CB2A|nr:LysR family transcriptional regulator [Deefgea piscis]QZA80134.1 LysR family transcriptional regulator [Deefgea piscis]
MNISSERLQGIRAFIEVAQCSSFTAAAERMALTRSAVGKAVRRLEERLGVQLLERTTRSVKLTQEGARFFQSTLKALNELEMAEAALLDSKNGLTGSLRIALPTLFGRCWILPALLELANTHTGLQLELQFSNELQHLQQDGIDLAVRIGQLPNSAQLIARPLGIQTVQLYASPAFLTKQSPILSPKQLSETRCIVSHPGQHWLLCNEYGELEDFPLFEALALDDAQAILDAAVAGLGVARLPTWLAADAIATGQLQPLLTSSTPPGRPIHLLWIARPYLPARLRLTINHLITHCQANPW